MFYTHGGFEKSAPPVYTGTLRLNGSLNNHDIEGAQVGTRMDHKDGFRLMGPVKADVLAKAHAAAQKCADLAAISAGSFANRFAPTTRVVDPDAPEYKCIWDLMNAVDSFIPQPARPVDQPFLMAIEDVFGIKGRGTVLTGRIERGVVKVGETVEIVGVKATKSTTITGVEMFNKTLNQGEAGDNVGCLVRGIERTEVERGQVLAAPGSITPHKRFKGEVYVLSKEEGGRHTPFFTGYRPQFYVRTTDVTGTANLPEGVEMVMPGDNIQMDIELIYPIAIEEGLRFAIREGGRTVGAGVVTKIEA